MTNPSQPTHVPPVLPPAPVPQESEKVAKVATVLVRAKSGTRKFLTHFAAPVASGALTGLLVSRRNRSENDDDVTLDDTSE
jgi:hypothetical protein